MSPLLDLELSVSYPGKARVLDGARLAIQEGEILGLVGQSGSGKSTLALAVLGLLRYKGGCASGRIHFEGRDLLRATERELRSLRGRRMAYIPQSPQASLNPQLRVGAHFEESWRAHSPVRSTEDQFAQMLEQVSLPGDAGLLRRYPAELSVGMAQRVLIALSLLHHPRLVIADEATSALDVITQSEILALLGELSRREKLAMLFISHDLLSVAGLCHRVAILERGRIVECRPTGEVFREPAHPYTRRLLEALPKRPPTGSEEIALRRKGPST